MGLFPGQAVIVEEVHGPQHGPVAGLLADVTDMFIELLLVHLPQELLAEISGHLLHLRGNGGVLAGEVGVVAAGVHHARA